MFCKECQALSNLDAYLPDLTTGQLDGPKIRHHNSYNNLCDAAKAGCELCALIVDMVEYRNKKEWITPYLVEDAQHIYCSFSTDSLYFTFRHDGENSDGLGLRLSTDADSPLASYFAWRHMSEDSSSIACFNIAKQWLKTCHEAHDKCPKTILPLPKRVVDVGEKDQEPVLYITNGALGQWLTLSHCWGPKQTFRTMSTNIASHCKALPFAGLPRTFRDAITITRELGYRFLWIDSLCIVQDSREDWEEESKKMASIYQHALLNISAESSPDDHSGIFQSVKQSRKFENRHVAFCCYHSSEKLKVTLYASFLLPEDDSRRLRAANPLQKRGWVLQESALAARKLQYFSTGLEWYCEGLSAREDSSQFDGPTIDDQSIHGISAHSSQHPISDEDCDSNVDDSHIQYSLEWWYRRINNYTTRRLTFKSDQFPALLGLATDFAARTGYHYIHGHWREDLHRALLWQGTVSPEYADHNPSWSWAVLGFHDGNKPYIIEKLKVKGSENFDAELIEEDVETTLPESNSSKTTLKFRAWCQPFSTFCHGRLFYAKPTNLLPSYANTSMANEILLLPDALESRHPPNSKWCARISPDIGCDGLALLNRKITILRIAEFADDWMEFLTEFHKWYLMVEVIRGHDNLYRRVGVIEEVPMGEDNVYSEDSEEDSSTSEDDESKSDSSGNEELALEGFELRTIVLI